jgi:hypothetical protein
MGARGQTVKAATNTWHTLNNTLPRPLLFLATPCSFRQAWEPYLPYLGTQARFTPKM